MIYETNYSNYSIYKSIATIKPIATIAPIATIKPITSIATITSPANSPALWGGGQGAGQPEEVRSPGRTKESTTGDAGVSPAVGLEQSASSQCRPGAQGLATRCLHPDLSGIIGASPPAINGRFCGAGRGGNYNFCNSDLTITCT